MESSSTPNTLSRSPGCLAIFCLCSSILLTITGLSIVVELFILGDLTFIAMLAAMPIGAIQLISGAMQYRLTRKSSLAWYLALSIGYLAILGIISFGIVNFDPFVEGFWQIAVLIPIGLSWFFTWIQYKDTPNVQQASHQVLDDVLDA